MHCQMAFLSLLLLPAGDFVLWQDRGNSRVRRG
jgi:hypothetical protein